MKSTNRNTGLRWQEGTKNFEMEGPLDLGKELAVPNKAANPSQKYSQNYTEFQSITRSVEIDKPSCSGAGHTDSK